MLEFNFQFRFADWKDKLLLTFGILLAIVQGTAMPMQILFFGGMIDTFVDDSQIREILKNVNWNTSQYPQEQALQNVEILRHGSNLLFYFKAAFAK